MNKADSARKPYLDLTWLLRTFAQPADVQFDLYCSFTGVADDLASDFETAILHKGDGFLDRNPDIKAFDKLLEKHFGQPEYWTEEALKHDPFWEQLRIEAAAILGMRGISKLPPDPLNITFVQADEEPDGALATLKALARKMLSR
ncbi:hypothetical protein [Parasedimentitalea maritima]|uniref:Uncharacterized protein n=1 Tax=Parasedimentitalea maritima TaxID=2578117 RepID=A0A6A4R979_9RHOB|nr:hypothetical protein [Zongyanglinia marina]KAE9628899.1 hypothetical protein GP644_14125 [Zongyanglinia marina]